MGEVLTLAAHGHTLRIHDQPGKVRAAWLRGEPYEAELLEHIYEEDFRGVAVDAGANIGNHTLWMAVVCGLEVWAFEPVHHEALRANVALNPPGRVVREPVALGADTGAARHAGAGRLAVGAGDLQVWPLDSYRLDGVSVMKLDVEGMEPDVLRGAEQTIRRCRPVIFAEAGTLQAIADQAGLLEPWGYRTTRIFQQPKTRVFRWDP